MSIVFSANTPSITHESIDGEVVIINMNSGNYYSLDGTGAEIWGLIDRGYSSSTIASIVSSKYDTDGIDISDTIDRFFSDLEREELIVTKSQNSDEPPVEESDAGESMTFSIPQLNRYSDMQELLLLDPIHEVDATGWPSATV